MDDCLHWLATSAVVTVRLDLQVFVDTLIGERLVEAKRRIALAIRGLDFAKAESIFAGTHFTRIDNRHDYGEARFVTAGHLRDRFVVVVWTPRENGRRIISMRHGHGREKARFQAWLD